MFADFDERWFHAFCRGEDEAWDFLMDSAVARQVKRICKTAEADLKDRNYLRQETWEDFQQQCLVAIHAAAKQQQKDGKVPTPGLFVHVAKVTCFGIIRRAKGTAQGMYQAADVRDEAGEKRSALEVHGVDLSALAAFQEVERNDLIERSGLDEKQSAVFWPWLEGHSVAELARSTGIPEETLRSRLKAALAKIRKALEEGK